MRIYSKPSLTIEQQILLLEERGLSIPDHKRASRHLSNISYYRLSAYMIPFREIGPDSKHIDKFRPGATWDDVYNLYKFDRKFRLLVFDAIERIEMQEHLYILNIQDNTHPLAKTIKTKLKQLRKQSKIQNL